MQKAMPIIWDMGKKDAIDTLQKWFQKMTKTPYANTDK